ncbi:MAG: Hsp20/alpha crystallin family protein [Phycisphaerales bacterium]|jgi:HSP20 family molecular chaperone IbpA|nr:Hsp20/alpha crystallin family protein [Phycisphaerales bacterium]
MIHSQSIECAHQDCAHQDGTVFYFHRGKRPTGSVDDDFGQFCRGTAWKPATNIYRDEENVYVILDLSGIDSDCVDIQCCETTLEVSGQRIAPPPPLMCGPLTVLQMEIDHGPFCVKVQFDFTLDADEISAEYDKGQLQLTIPYTKEEK